VNGVIADRQVDRYKVLLVKRHSNCQIAATGRSPNGLRLSYGALKKEQSFLCIRAPPASGACQPANSKRVLNVAD
jgi:hypothetical protein